MAVTNPPTWTTSHSSIRQLRQDEASSSIDEYRVGWICALSKELTAARAMLDEEHEPFKNDNARDNNSYVLGRVGEHNVVMTCLPAGVYGTNAAATVANNMVRTFTGLRFGLMVGIGGGIPNLEKEVDIRLGDVVVSQPDETHGGVVQYDLGKNLGKGKFERRGFLSPPPTQLLTALSTLQSHHDLAGSQIPKFLAEMIERRPNLVKSGYSYPGLERDRLYCSHGESSTANHWCTRCQNGAIWREPRDDQSPVVHYGIIASGNELIRNAAERDWLGEELGAKCIDMEAAGLMNEFPCIVIRGICDYADAHKNDVWQKYAAATAAAFAKELLSVIQPTEVAVIKRANDVLKYNLGLNLFDAPDMGEGLFVGRKTELQDMESILQPQVDSLGSTRKVLILGGMGGIGKTQVAINYAKRHRNFYFAIFWLNANTEATLNSSLRAIANRIIPPETVGRLDDGQVWVHVSNWLSEQGNSRWLLIFDNYDDPDEYKITQYYPSVAHGSIIITTRQPDRASGEKIKVQSMAKAEESLCILATRSGRENVMLEPDARTLAKRLNGHPLALATAGAFLSQSSLSFAKYLKQYEAKWKVIDSIKELPEYPSRTFYTTWDLSFTQIEQQNGRAANLLRFLAYLDHQDIWYELLHGGQSGDQPLWFIELASDEFIFENAMQTLVRYCIVESHHRTGSYSLHMCVHDWALNSLNRDIDATKYWLAFDCLAGNIGLDDSKNLSAVRYRRFVPHAVRLVHERFQQAESQQEQLQDKLNEISVLAELLYLQVQYTAGELMYQRALTGKEKALGPDHTSTLLTVNNLGNLYYSQGKLGEAEQMYQRALAGYEKALGPDHTSTLDTVSNLGTLYNDQGKLGEAEQMYQRALAGYEKVSQSETIPALNAVSNFGLLYYSQGKLKDAEKMFQRAVLGRRKVLGLDHPRTLKVENDLKKLAALVKVKQNESSSNVANIGHNP